MKISVLHCWNKNERGKLVSVLLCLPQSPLNLAWNLFLFLDSEALPLFCLFTFFLLIFLSCLSWLVLLSLLYNIHNTNNHALGGIRTHNPSKRSAADSGKNFNDTIGNQTRHLLSCSSMSQPTAPLLTSRNRTRNSAVRDR